MSRYRLPASMKQHAYIKLRTNSNKESCHCNYQ